MKYTLSIEDMHFLLNRDEVTLFKISDITLNNREKEWQRFVKRNLKTGYTDQMGNPTDELRSIISIILNNNTEITWADAIQDAYNAHLKATIFIFGNAAVLAKKTGPFKLMYEIERIDFAQREQVLLSEYSLAPFIFSDKPFSVELPVENAWDIINEGTSGNIETLRHKARDLGLEVKDLANFISQIQQGNIEQYLVARDLTHPGTQYLMVAKKVGTIAKFIENVDEQGRPQGICFFERLAQQDLWDYFTDFKGR